VKDKALFLTSENEGPKYIVEVGKEMNKMGEKKVNKTEGKKDSALPWVMIKVTFREGANAFFLEA
jgi:hypothetical protein